MATFSSSVEIGKRIKMLRRRAKLSQEKLAESIELSSQQLRKYEAGINSMNADKLQLTANALGVSVLSFFQEYPIEVVPLSDEERNLVGSFRAIEDNKIRESIMTLTTLAGSVKKVVA